MLDPRNVAGTATLTYSEEFNTYTPWNGRTGLDWAPGWAIAYSFNDYGFNAGDNQTWYINPSVPETRSANPFSVANGILTITAKPTDPAIAQYTGGQPYTSGQVSTFREFSQTYGYFEMRAKLPAGNGIGSAFWLLAKDMSHPPELDIMESVGRDPTAIFTTAHSRDPYADHTAAWARDFETVYSNQGWSRVVDMSKSFHTYGLNWQPDKITWYMDGVKLFEMNTPSDLNKPMYMITGLGMGDPPDVTGFVGTPAPDAHARMQIDYIRAYSTALNGNDQVVGGNGNDKINGGPGKDHLKGGTGKDTFIFADPLHKTRNLDTISDFSVKDDSIWLDNAIFQKLGTGTLSRPGLLNKAFFTIGDKAKDSNDYLIYNKTTGYLYYDADGSGKGAAVAFAKLSPNLGLSNLDFYII